jgi:methionyl-tRNA formyltransferase
MRALFFGTPAIAVPALQALAELADIAGVVCQPDRPAGRGLEQKPPAVKVAAERLGLPVVQPTKVRTPDFAQWMRDANADVALVMAYGRILPKEVLEAPRRGCMNLHASLLPRYRGAAPITWAVVRGETETGISLMQMDAGCDTGPVYTRHPIPIGENATADDVARDLAELAAFVVRLDLLRAVAGELPPEPQDDSSATLAPLLTKEDGRIDWTRSALDVHNHIRGMTSWPGAFTRAGEKWMKILESRVGQTEASHAAPGTVLSANRQAFEVTCGSGTIRVLRAQIEGRKPLSAGELLSGRSIHTGMTLAG